MSHIVVTGADFVSVPYQPSAESGLNSRLINDSGTTVVLNDFEYAALSSGAFTSGTLVDGGAVSSDGSVLVERAADVLPATGTEAIFNIDGGRVLVTGLWAEVTTVMTATATTVTTVHNPDDTGASQTIVAASTVTSDPVGTIYSTTGTVGSAYTEGLNFGIGQALPLLLKPGTIDITTSATNTGALKWTIRYVAIDAGATVTATALA